MIDSVTGEKWRRADAGAGIPEEHTKEPSPEASLAAQHLAEGGHNLPPPQPNLVPGIVLPKREADPPDEG